MWKCMYCGNENGDNYSFCTNCGQPRKAAAGMSEPVNQVRPRKKSKLPLILGIVVLALALIGGGLWFFLGRTPHYRMVSSQYTTGQGSTQIITYTYSPDGTMVTAEQTRDGELYAKATGTVDKTGSCTSMTWMDPDGSVRYRYEYENDKDGNHLVSRRYESDGRLSQMITAEYNKYRIVEKQETVFYDESGKVSRRQITTFTDPNNGISYTEYSDGEKSPVSRFVRVYNEKNQLVQQTSYDENGQQGTVFTYVRNDGYYPVSYTQTISGTEEAITFNYQWEKVR